MRTCRLFCAGTLFVWVLLACARPGWASAETRTPDDFFESRIRPVLVDHCYECHSAQARKLKGGLRLDTREGLLAGGDSGKPAVVPDDSSRSLLIAAIRQTDKELKMPPPKHAAKLDDEKVAAFVAWVDAGALMPQGSDASKSNDPRTQKIAEAAKGHWAFTAPREPSLPKVKDMSWAQTSIDRFILAKLEANGLKPSPPADPRTLIRRMTYDMTGLPPSPLEVDEFITRCKHGKESAISELVERLLSSPQYGERWARHWLDVARYSDTKGYVYAREERFFPHSWAYRDWVVRAFNDDLPYDRFLLLQIAADQLVSSQSPDLAAMGFLTGGRRFIGVTRDIIDDRIDAVTRGTMALTVQCARCHDHKYDPIPTADYYSLYGVFHDATDHPVRLDPTASDNPSEAFEKEYQARVKKLAEMMRQRRAEAEARLRTRVGDYLTAQLEMNKYPEEGFDQVLTADDVIPESVRRWRDFLQTRDRENSIFAPWRALADLPLEGFESRANVEMKKLRSDLGAGLNPSVAEIFATAPASMREAAARYGKLFADVGREWQDALTAAKTNEVASPSALPSDAHEELRRFLYDPRSPTSVPDVGIVNNEWFFPTGVIDELWKYQGEVDRWIIRTPDSSAFARVMEDAEPEPNPRIFLRGNPATKGREVPRQFLQVLAGPERKPFQHGSGRLELAQDIVNPENPLTARVMVNRIWAEHFGEGLVTTPSDFGLRAKPPSHPELLDWLALRFIESGWSVKAMHRLILNSAVYQQASDVTPGLHPRTSSGVALRAPLQIDPENRLLSHFNRQRLDFEEMRDSLLAVTGGMDMSLGGKPVEMFDAENHRRSLYGLVDRQFLPPLFRAFDFANPDLHIPQRHETTVSQQALFFLNNPWVANRAKTLEVGLNMMKPGSPLTRPSDTLSPRPTRGEGRVRGATGSVVKGEWSIQGEAVGIRQLYRTVFQRQPSERELETGKRFLRSAQSTQPPLPPKPVETAWKYGWGEYDESAKRTGSFNALPHFTGDAWQGGEKWPDAKLGWAQLTAKGGHPGNDLQHACIRRWTAPADATISISSTMINEPDAGDGIRGFIVSSRHGELKSGEAHASQCDMSLSSVEVKAGDTLDFIVDIKKVLNSDQFLWAPVIKVVANAKQAQSAGNKTTWNAAGEFGGTPEPYHAPLEPWEQYIQVLLMSNEFLFVD